MSIAPSCFADHMLNIAAGTTVDGCAYQQWASQLNMMKLRALGQAYKQGWLTNLMARITPMTVRNGDDYVMMADLFITEVGQAQQLLNKMSKDMSAFATAAGLFYSPTSTPQEMQGHIRLYNRIAKLLSTKFGFAAPQPFASTTIDASVQAQMPFIRTFMRQYAA
jgi:hypothetical protein